MSQGHPTCGQEARTGQGASGPQPRPLGSHGSPGRTGPRPHPQQEALGICEEHWLQGFVFHVQCLRGVLY